MGTAIPDDISFLAQARGTKAHDDWDAYMVETMRALGRETGQVKHYEGNAQAYLDRAECARHAADEHTAEA